MDSATKSRDTASLKKTVIIKLRPRGEGGLCLEEGSAFHHQHEAVLRHFLSHHGGWRTPLGEKEVDLLSPRRRCRHLAVSGLCLGRFTAVTRKWGEHEAGGHVD